MFSHDASLPVYGREVGAGENILFCYPTRNAAKCLYPQRQRGSFGLEAHIVKTPFVLKSLEEFFSFSFNILNIPVSSCPLPIL